MKYSITTSMKDFREMQSENNLMKKVELPLRIDKVSFMEFIIFDVLLEKLIDMM